MRISLVLVTALSLGACALPTTPQMVASTPRSVVYRYYPEVTPLQRVATMAEAYCKASAAHAEMRDQRRVDVTYYQEATDSEWRCVP